jgi:hypothetical protein
MDLLVAIDTLDDLVHNARTVPLTDQVRVERDELRQAVEQVHASLPPDAEAATADPLGRLDDLVAAAKPVPLTDQVRIDRDALYEALDGLRAAFWPLSR